LAKNLRDDVILPSQDLLAALGDDILALQLIQARARTESVLLPEVEIDPATALEIARRNRRDWANARASLVDSWRLIEFNADNLESSLDLTFNGAIGNNGRNPFNIDTDTGRLQVGLAWDAPITRLQERNTYRQSLIEFEQARRSYYQFEDGIWQLLRGQVRQLQLNQFNFELGRESVRIAAAQIELNDDIRLFRDSRGLPSGPTAAQDVIRALEALLNSQNSLLNIYVNYEVVRRGLDFDLGTMELTPEGLWIDPGSVDADQLLMLPGTSAEGMIECGCNECGLCLESSPTEAIYGTSYHLGSSEHHDVDGQTPIEISPDRPPMIRDADALLDDSPPTLEFGDEPLPDSEPEPGSY
jgi:ferredoxin